MGPSGFPDYPTCIGTFPKRERCSLWEAVSTAIYPKYLSGIPLLILKSSTYPKSSYRKNSTIECSILIVVIIPFFSTVSFWKVKYVNSKDVLSML